MRRRSWRSCRGAPSRLRTGRQLRELRQGPTSSIRRTRPGKAAEAHAEELHEAANTTTAHVSSSWNDLQKSWNQHISKLRHDVDARKAEHDARKAEHRAEFAEADALFAIDYAYATIEEAEAAVLDAITTRMKADELVAR
jgi:hypothetical protein